MKHRVPGTRVRLDVSLLLGVAVAALGCENAATRNVSESNKSDASGATTPVTADDLRAAYRAATGDAKLEPTWEPCPILTGGAGTDATCAQIPVPLTWLDATSEKISLFVKRIPASGPVARQLWLLMGGPGSASYPLELAASLVTDPGTEYLLLDYRGTGRSDRLSCPDEENASFTAGLTEPERQAKMKRCFDAVKERWPGETLSHFNITETAADLGVLVQSLRKLAVPVRIYGVSFGTYVADRYLNLFPDQPDGVIMDSFTLPTGLVHRDQDVDDVARKILGLCAANVDCGARLGSDAVGKADSVIQGLASDRCPELAAAGIDSRRFQEVASAVATDAGLWNYLPALYYRADRCTASDVGALSAFAAQHPPPWTQDVVPFSEPLNRLISRSEWLDHDDLAATHPDALIASPGFATEWLGLWDSVPTYPRDALVGDWARPKVPVLILQAELDALAHVGNGQAAHDHYPGSTLVSFPYRDHIVAFSFDCGVPIIGAFVTDPKATLDTSCTARIPAPSFTVTTEEAMKAFGTSSLWD